MHLVQHLALGKQGLHSNVWPRRGEPDKPRLRKLVPDSHSADPVRQPSKRLPEPARCSRTAQFLPVEAVRATGSAVPPRFDQRVEPSGPGWKRTEPHSRYRLDQLHVRSGDGPGKSATYLSV